MIEFEVFNNEATGQTSKDTKTNASATAQILNLVSKDSVSSKDD